MPLFHWDSEKMENVTSNRFWLYWTIAIPLTLVVMGIVTAFAVHQSRTVAKEVEKREAVLKK